MAAGPAEGMEFSRGERPPGPYLWEHRRELFGTGFWLGVGLGAGTGFDAAESKHMLDNGIGVLTTETLLGVGLLATVLAALAFLATFFDQHYREALQELSGGFLRAVVPFRVVAFAGAVSAGVGVASMAFWSILSHTLKSAALGLVTGATVCAIVGTWDLVRDQTVHGLKREEMLGRERVSAGT
jgi:hypothetical protein